MDRIDEQHVSEPGLVVLDITSHDEATALAVMSELEKWWATSGMGTLRRVPAEPGVKARVYADIRRLGTQAYRGGQRRPESVTQPGSCWEGAAGN